ncbi:MAG: hypothetical protein IKE64_05115 [Thermoguttaceae bacterium]|nr:hypothetical protein [Thermoguttaceae bacterium]
MGEKFDMWKELDRLRDVEKARNLRIIAEDIQRRQREEQLAKMTPEEREAFLKAEENKKDENFRRGCATLVFILLVFGFTAFIMYCTR